MTPEERARLIKRYEAAYGAVSEALAPFGPRTVDTAPRGEWSAREIVHHLADAELMQGVRLRMLMAQERPFLAAYDETKFQERLHYYRPVEASLALFRAALESNVELVTLLFPEDWSREGTHEEIGPFSVETWLERAAGHPYEHVEQLEALSRLVQP